MNPNKWIIFEVYWTEIETASGLSNKKHISTRYSQMFTPVDTLQDKTVNQILDTIAHYYFKGLYDKEDFLSRYLNDRIILYNPDIKNKSNVMDEVDPQLIHKLGLSFGKAFDNYRAIDWVKAFFVLASNYANYIPNGTKMTLDIVLNSFISAVIKPFSMGPLDSAVFGYYIRNIDDIESEVIAHNLLKQLTQLFDKFCKNYIKFKDYTFIYDIPPPRSNNINKDSRRSAVNRFKDTFYFLTKKRRLLMISLTEESNIPLCFVGITLYDGRVLIVKDTVLKTNEDRIFWYTLVLIHELCHLHRLSAYNYKCEKYTPSKLGYESGNYGEINIFGKIMGKSDMEIKTLKEIKYLNKDFCTIKFPQPQFVGIGDKMARLEAFKALMNKFDD